MSSAPPNQGLTAVSPLHDGAAGDTSGVKRSNVLANKLSNVLSASYANTEIRDALRIYDNRYGQTGIDDDLDLQHEAQKQVIAANARIVDDFSKVAKQLDRVGTLIDTLNETCASIRKHVVAAKQETAPMLEEASVLLAQKAETENKQALLNAFTKHFLVSDEDLTTLTSSAEPVNEKFFEVLARVKQIHKDCELLLGYENQRLGLELMEQTTRDLNAGYKKLFNSTLRAFKGLDLEDPHISGSIRRSLRALSERPALFQNCLDSFAEARQSTLSDAFQKALTDSTLGAARAIEFSTHDPLRYMGDMLAWVHSATVSEMEALEGLFISDADEIGRGLHAGKAADPFAMSTDEGDEARSAFDGHAALNSLISRNMASVAHTLTQRIDVTVRNLGDPVEIYKAYNLLSFYHDMFKKLIRHSVAKPAASTLEDDLKDNTILAASTNLQSQTFKHFETVALEALQSSVDETPAADLSPPAALSETLSQFTRIAHTRGPNLDTPEFAKLYTTLIKPILDLCSSLAEDLSDSSPTPSPSATIYRLNYLTPVRDTLSSLNLPIAESPLAAATAEITTLSTTLSNILSHQFLTTSGLTSLQTTLSSTQSTIASATKRKQTLLNTHRDSSDSTSDLLLEHLAAQLDAFLASALMDTQDELAKLGDREVAAAVVRVAVDAFCDEFETVVEELEEIDEGVEREALARKMGKSSAGEGVNGDNGGEHDGEAEDEPSLREVYPRTLEEVRALLS